ncbi:15538_t:CDS:2 [Entrophospora sp. SA101]|nr:15538_t:CDS:2 [Entrophospora sp. SA101]
MGKNKKAGQVFKITNQTQINHNQRGPLRGLTYNLTHDSTYKKYDTNANSSYFEKGGGKRMPKRIILILEQCFLTGNIDKSYRMSPQEMLDVLKSKVEEGEIENSDLPKLPTIQGWITRYSAQLREKNAKTTLGVSN